MYTTSVFKSIVTVIVAILASTPIFAQNKKTQTLKLPITFEPGYGIFAPGMVGANFEKEAKNNPWYKTYLPVKGIPTDWKNTKKTMIWFDAHQFVYQNWKAGTIPSDRFDELKKSWMWEPDLTKLSAKPTKCFVYLLMGEDANGQVKLIVDQNNNLDFSDDQPFEPITNDFSKLDSLSHKALTIDYQLYANGKTIDSKIPLFITKMGEMLLYNFPHYATTVLTTSSSDQEIVVCSGRFGEASFSSPSLALMADSLRGKKVNLDLTIGKEEYFTIGDVIYKFKGIDLPNKLLELEQLPKGHDLVSSQIGFRAIPFQGNEFTSLESLSLNKYNGKYLFIDFWGTWCSPCIKEIPHIKEAYEKLNKDKIEFLGIVGEDKPTSLMSALKKWQITWPQILDDDTNKIVQKYRISGYPTSFLIDPNGIVIAKNLRGEKLFETISKLIDQKELLK